MKIAVPFEDGQVFQHFGRSAQFKFYEAENGQLLRTEVIPTNGQGHGALAGFLVQHGADVVLCGGIGTGAQVALMQAGIQLFGGLSGAADAAVADYLAGKLVFDPDIHCTVYRAIIKTQQGKHDRKARGEGCTGSARAERQLRQ